jgi:hypothetical protein
VSARVSTLVSARVSTLVSARVSTLVSARVSTLVSANEAGGMEWGRVTTEDDSSRCRLLVEHHRVHHPTPS